MSKVKIEDIRNMTVEELNNKILELKEEVFKLRFEKKTGRIEKPHRVSEARKEIARCYTILKEKQSGPK